MSARLHSLQCIFPEGCNCGASEFNKMADELSALRSQNTDLAQVEAVNKHYELVLKSQHETVEDYKRVITERDQLRNYHTQTEEDLNALLASDKMLREELNDCLSALQTLGTFHRHSATWKSCEIAETINEAEKALSTPPPEAYAQLVAKIQEPLVKDKERLDALTKHQQGYGNGWILRMSTTGRGLRLHEHGGEGTSPTPREAIDKFENESR